MRVPVVVVSALLALLGALTGLIEAFLVPFDPVQGLSIAAVLAAVTNYTLAVQGRAATSATFGALVPAIAWFATVMYLGTGRPEGDLVVPGDLTGLGFILLGVIGAALGIARRPRDPHRPDESVAAAAEDDPSDSERQLGG